MPDMSHRNLLRQRLITQRKNLDLKQQEAASDHIAHLLLKHPWFWRSQRVAFYFACNMEITTFTLLKLALEMDKECFLPVLHPIKKNELEFIRYHHNDPLQTNRYGVPEPYWNEDRRISPQALGVVFVPLVGFDLKGNRLGMGGGYYDRTFSFRSQHVSANPKLIGLAYEFQRIDELKKESWDVSLDMVATENQIYLFD